MSKHYEERSYPKGYGNSDYDEYRVRRRSTSRSSRGKYYEGSNGYRQRQLSRSGSGSSVSSVSDYEYKGHYVSNDRPLVRVPRDIIRAPTPPPVIQRVVERAPTPEPDIVERVIVRPQPQQLIERIIERPRTPPPKIIDKEISEPAPPPIVRTRIVKVDHSPRHYSNAVSNIQTIQKPRPEVYQRSAALNNYGYHDGYVDYYNFAPIERSYSTTLSTAEMYPTSMYAQQPITATYQMGNMQNMNTLNGIQQQQQQQMYPPQNNLATYNAYPSYGYSYGYRPVQSNLIYNQQQAYPTNNYIRPNLQQPPLGVQGF